MATATIATPIDQPQPISIEQLIETASAHKLKAEWAQAAESYKAIAEYYSADHCWLIQEINARVEYANMLRKTNTHDEAIEAHKVALALYIKAGITTMVAVTAMRLGEYLAELGRYKDAIEQFTQAANAYDGSAQPTHRDNCQLLIANMHVLLNRYATAAGIFEAVVKVRANDQLLKFGVRDLLLKAGICHLAGGCDKTQLQTVMEGYAKIVENWHDSSQHKQLLSFLEIQADGTTSIEPMLKQLTSTLQYKNTITV